MSENNINLVDSFRGNCLIDLKSKQESLTVLQETAINQIRQQGQQKIQQLSKVLVDLEDSLVSQLRIKCQQILQVQQHRLSQQLQNLQQFIKQRIDLQNSHINKIMTIIEANSEKSQKMLGKIAAGKIENEFKQFTEEIMHLGLVPCQFKFNQTQIVEIVDDIIDTLNFKYDKYNQHEQQNQSEHYQNSKSTLISKSKTQIKQNVSKLSKQQIKNASHITQKSFLRNQSTISKNLQQKFQTQQCGPSGLDEYKRSKMIRKARKLQQKVTHKEQSPQKDVDNLIRLALEKKRLLKQLESI